MKIAKKISTILCEDIREEKGGKLSYLGVFGIENSGILLDTVPVDLPKICLAVMLSEMQVQIENMQATIKSPGKDKIPLNFKSVPKHDIGKNITLGIFVTPFKVATTGKAKFEIKFNNEKKPSITFEFNILLKDQKSV